jgi:flagellar basal body-associated protein FliL
MLKLIEKFEKIGNQFLIKASLLLVSFLKSMIPQKFKYIFIDIEERLKEKSKNLVADSKNKVVQKIELVKVKSTETKKIVTQKVKDIKAIDYKQKLLELKGKVTYFLQKSTYKEIIFLGLATIFAPIKSIFNWIIAKLSLSSKSVGYYSVIVVSSVGIIYGINYNVQVIKNKGRKPASIKRLEFKEARPYYYKQTRKHFHMTHLKLPLYFNKGKKKSGISTLTLDFNIITSNRRTTQFLEMHQFQIRDHLMMNVEQIQSEFPFEDEGKAILKDKIQIEVNNFLHLNKIDGSIDDVQLIYILGT